MFDSNNNNNYYNNVLSENIESIQHNAALPITGASRGASKEKLYRELGLKSLKDERWLRRLCYLHKVLSTKILTYLYKLISSTLNSNYNLGCYRALCCRATLVRNLFYLSVLANGVNWIKLDQNSRLSCNVPQIAANFFKVFCKKHFQYLWHTRIETSPQMKLGFIYIHERKFRHKFTDTVNPLYSCAIATERTNPFFLCCQNYASFSIALINELSNINCEIISLRPTALLEVIFYGDKRLNDKSNHWILNQTPFIYQLH